MGLEQHRHESPARIGFAVITVSDTRALATDRGGDFLVQSVEDAGHALLARSICRDEPTEIEAALRDVLAQEEVDVVLVTGGTGVAPRDVTVPTLRALFASEIPGFGELFRHLSFAQVGTAAILSRATAGVVEDRVVFLLPGSPKALALAMDEIILKEAGHLVSQVRG
jgi:molybdenum cofactor biosynthesis protein B